MEGLPALGIGSGAALTPGVERLVEGARAAGPERLGRREAITETLVGLSFLVASAALAAWLPWEGFDPVTALLLVLLYGAASRVQLEDGVGYTVPTQVIFVPMLFFLPAPLVPLAVVAGTLAGNLPDYLARRKRPGRALLTLGDSWHAIGPALVFGLAAPVATELAAWPLLAGALAAQFALDFAVSTLREWVGMGTAPRTIARLLAWVYLTDACLAPIGLFAALIAAQEPLALLMLAPMGALLANYAGERRDRITNALELSQAYQGTARLLGELLEADDAYTGSHSKGVVELSLLVSERMGLDESERRTVEFAALLHDVGKIGIPDEIINKPGPLDDAEWELMRQHTVIGQEMLDRVGGMLSDVGRVVRASHERYDGSGYPDGLAGQEIPLPARIIACCDAFNAMTTSRPYRVAMSEDVAVRELLENAGSQFDPAVVRELVALTGVRAAPAAKAAAPVPA